MRVLFPSSVEPCRRVPKDPSVVKPTLGRTVHRFLDPWSLVPSVDPPESTSGRKWGLTDPPVRVVREVLRVFVSRNPFPVRGPLTGVTRKKSTTADAP